MNCNPEGDDKQAQLCMQVLDATYNEFVKVRHKIELLLDELEMDEEPDVKAEGTFEVVG